MKSDKNKKPYKTFLHECLIFFCIKFLLVLHVILIAITANYSNLISLISC